MATDYEAVSLDGGYTVSCPSSHWLVELGSMEYACSSQLVGTTWNTLPEAILTLAKSPRSDTEGGSGDTGPSRS